MISASSNTRRPKLDISSIAREVSTVLETERKFDDKNERLKDILSDLQTGLRHKKRLEEIMHAADAMITAAKENELYPNSK